MTPADEIARLNRQLVSHGQTIELRRMSRGANQTVEQAVTAKAFVRQNYKNVQELVNSVSQDEDYVIMSPTEIIAANWTSGSTSGYNTRIPIKGNKVVIAGKVRTIELATGIFMNDVLIRIEFKARG